ncbi:PREDICTED: THAP domain-containing protein 3 [Chinchilla lanigera]|uniref:THAP domain-containing protein 3 n=1 Tax=Chinchilla lanigera TaxID=34839 RepID=UPI0006974A4E|nr:PREDICTED: THAP domain-containing protein 3 [Chinchilla lanigera]
MPKSCAARQCCNRYSSRRKQLTFHRFPFSRPELLREWVLNIGRAGFEPKQHTVICSEHFRPECFSAFGNRKNLKHNAVPTVFAFREPAQCCDLELATFSCPGAVSTHVALRAVTAGTFLLEAWPGALGRGPRCVCWWTLFHPSHAGLVQNADPAGARDAGSPEVRPEAGAREQSPSWSTDAAREELQLLPRTEGPLTQAVPPRPEAAAGAGAAASHAGPRRARPGQPPDHSYALRDAAALKKKLFLALRENAQLRKRLKAQRLVARRLRGRLRARRAGRPEPRPEPPS